MLWNAAATISGLTFILLMTLVFVAAARRSPVGWLMISVEYFYVLGLGFFPLLLSLGLINVPEIYSEYEPKNGEIRLATFVHIVVFALGAAAGYFAGPMTTRASKAIEAVAVNNRISNYTWFYGLSFASLTASALYLGLVGFETALLNASLSRSGDFSGLVGYEQYQFLKRLAFIGPFAMIFVPFIIVEGRRVASTFSIVTMVAIVLYAHTVARVAILEMIGTFLVLYLSLKERWSKGFILLTSLFVLLMIFVFVYGKTLVGTVSSYFFVGGDFSLVRHAEEDDSLTYFFGHFGHLVYSIDAGIRTFFSQGPTFARDVILSPLGILPSFVFSAADLGTLSYQLTPENERFSCINTAFLSSTGECFAPAYYPGTSAYVLPFVGAFAFGFARFWMYAVVEDCWRRMRETPELLWLPMLILLVGLQLMLIIPSAISFATFFLLLVLFVLALQRLLAAAMSLIRT